MTTIDPTDETALSDLGGIFWLNDLVPLRGLEGLDEATDASIGERVLTADELHAMVISDVDRLVVVTGQDYGCSREKATILSMPVPGSLDAATMLEAVWAGYVASMKATEDQIDEDEMIVVDEIQNRLGAEITPYDRIYVSGGTYLENIDLSYDPATRTLTADPGIGS